MLSNENYTRKVLPFLKTDYFEKNENKIIFDSVYQGEYTIQNLIKSDNNCSAHFTYNRYPGKGYELIVITYNPTHETSFFLHSLDGTTKIDALEKRVKYLEEIHMNDGK